MRLHVVSYRDILQQGVHRSVQADFSTLGSCAGTDIHEPVRIVHCLGVVLHHHHGIALVAEFLEGSDKLPVVPLVKADARFIEDIQHVDQLGADLCRKADALALTS